MIAIPRVNTTDEFVTYMQHPTMLQLYMPGLVFIDRDGVIRAQYEGRDTFLEANDGGEELAPKEAMLNQASKLEKGRLARYTRKSDSTTGGGRLAKQETSSPQRRREDQATDSKRSEGSGLSPSIFPCGRASLPYPSN